MDQFQADCTYSDCLIEKTTPVHKRCDIGSIIEAVQKKQEGEIWNEHVNYTKLIMQQIPYPLTNHGQCTAALLRVSFETVEYG
jgi:hypothetical protein